MVTAGNRPGHKLVACWAGLTVVHQADLGPDWGVSSACMLLLPLRPGTPVVHGICRSRAAPMQTSTEPEGSHAPASEDQRSRQAHWSMSAPRRRRLAAYKALHAEDSASLQGRRDLAQLLFDVERKALEAAAAAEAEQMAAAERRSMRLGPGTMREGDAGHGGLRIRLQRCRARLPCAISATACVSDRA